MQHIKSRKKQIIQGFRECMITRLEINVWLPNEFKVLFNDSMKRDECQPPPPYRESYMMYLKDTSERHGLYFEGGRVWAVAGVGGW